MKGLLEFFGYITLFNATTYGIGAVAYHSIQLGYLAVAIAGVGALIAISLALYDIRDVLKKEKGASNADDTDKT